MHGMDVTSQSGEVIGDRPDTIESHGIDGQASEIGQDLKVVVLPVAVGVVTHRELPHLEPAFNDRPSIADCSS